MGPGTQWPQISPPNKERRHDLETGGCSILYCRYGMTDNNAEGKRDEHVNAKTSHRHCLFCFCPLRSPCLVNTPAATHNKMNDLVEFLRTHDEAFRRYMLLSTLIAPNRTPLISAPVATAFSLSTQIFAYKRHRTQMDTKQTLEHGCAV